ncbi:NAD(P)-binding protein, partial [Thelephora ganbajun]
RILVTGGTGFLGAHIVDLLLERGIRVVATARSEPKAKDFVERRSGFKDLLEVVVTGDLGPVGAFDSIAKDVDVIIHCASPLPNEPSSGSSLSQTLIEPAISGTLSILQAARKNPTLKRLVLTSSVGAVLDITKQTALEPYGDRYTANDWNPITYEQGVKSGDPPFVYRAGKKYAELEAWGEVDPASRHSRHTFDLTVFCPPLILGPWVHPLGPSGLDSLNYSNRQFRDIVRGDFRSSHLPEPLAPLWVDVRDVALAHVEAALRLDSGSRPPSNERYAICSPEKFNYHLVGEIIREEFPDWAGEILPPKKGIPPFKGVSLDGTPVTDDLGVTYRSFRECVIDTVRQLRTEVLREAERPT